MADSPRELVVIMFADVTGYSALSQRNERLALALVDQLRQTAAPLLAEFNGRLVKTIGDALMVEFRSALAAVACAIRLQESLHAHNATAEPDAELKVRIGIHMGDAVRQGDDLLGDTINIAARVEPKAVPGGIALTEAVYQQVRSKSERPIAVLGDFELKGIEGRTRLYQVVLSGQSAEPVQAAKPRESGRKLAAAVVVVAVLVAGVLLWKFAAPHDGGGDAAIPDKSIAVLPFENLSGDAGNAYFSSGTQDEILTRLAQISALKVISRTSTLKYASRPENLRQVGRELGVAAVLEGSVQRAGDTVRVNVQLIDAATDSHLWAESYDRDVKDIFAAETDIANKVAEALKAKLQPAEAAGVARVPTQNAAAYDFYLKGGYVARDYAGLPRGDERLGIARQAIPFYTQAIALDPGFALAYAQRSMFQTHLYWEVEVKDPALLAAARADAEKAYALAPDLPEAHLARGYVYYYGDKDYGKAAAEFERARQLNPNDMETVMAVAYISRRLGDLPGAIASLQRAVGLDPKHRDIYLSSLSVDYSMLAQYSKALAANDQVLADFPDRLLNRVSRVFLLLITGKVAEAKAALAAASVLKDPNGDLAYLACEIARLERDPQGMLKALAGQDATPGSGLLDELRFEAYYLAGDKAGMQAAGDSALRQLHAADAQGQDPQVMSSIAKIEAMRGDAGALKLMDRALALDPVSRDPIDGPSLLYDQALVQLRLGLKGPALDTLARLVAIPTRGRDISSAYLRVDPDWEPLRQEPRFQEIIAMAAAGEH